jgi:uncharacterized sulfatase
MENKKQIVFIMTDTTRFDMLGCYGNKDMISPNLDKLCSQGIRFDRAYSCQPVCGPARAAIFTGTYPHTNGSFANGLPIGDNVKTIGQRLNDKGVHTAYIGKWHVDGSDYFGLGRCPDGWDPYYWYDMRNWIETLPPDIRTRSRWEDMAWIEGVTEDFTYGHHCSDKALDFLGKHNDEDFFLVVSYDEPHGPCLCPEPYVKMYDNYSFERSPNIYDTLEDKPYYQKLWAGDNLKLNRDEVPVAFPLHYACNSYIDYEIGRVLDEVAKVAPDAMVIFTSDHGLFYQNHCINNKGPAVYEEIAKIPFIIKPGKSTIEEAEAKVYAESGTADNYISYSMPVSHIDITPTILDYMQLPIPKYLEGKSLLPSLVDPTIRINEQVFLEFTRYEIDQDGFGGLQMLRAAIDDRYKLSINLMDTDEMYDNQNDPFEMHNLINDDVFETILARNRLHDAIIEFMNTTRDPFRGYQWKRRPWRPDLTSDNWWVMEGFTRQRVNDEYEPAQLDYETGLEIEGPFKAKPLDPVEIPE